MERKGRGPQGIGDSTQVPECGSWARRRKAFQLGVRVGAVGGKPEVFDWRARVV